MTKPSIDAADEKATIRSRLLVARRERAPEARAGASAAACARLLDLAAAVGGVHVVAAYASFGTEPDTAPLLAGLVARGVRVLLPVLVKGNDLAWGWYTGPDSLVRGNLSGSPLLEPRTVLDVTAVLEAGIVVVPGLGVDDRGMRLGRGGGSYDRVLARIAGVGQPANSAVSSAVSSAVNGARRPWTVTLLYPGEVGVEVPVEAHDRPVDAAVTADGLTRFG